MAAYRYPSLPLERWQIEQGRQSDPSGAPTRPWEEWSDWERKKFYDQYGIWPEQARFDPLSLKGAPGRLQAQMEGVGEGEFYDPALRTLEGIERPPTAIQGSLVSATLLKYLPYPLLQVVFLVLHKDDYKHSRISGVVIWMLMLLLQAQQAGESLLKVE